MDELEKAHKDYEKRKIEIINKLTTLKKCTSLKWYEKEWCDQAIEFIREKGI